MQVTVSVLQMGIIPISCVEFFMKNIDAIDVGFLESWIYKLMGLICSFGTL